MAKKIASKTPTKTTETALNMVPTKTTVTVTKTCMGKDVGTDTAEDTLEVNKFVTEPAKISLTMGVTINLGNYEGARVDIGISVPCYTEEVEATHKFASTWVETKLVKEIEQLRDHARKRTTPSGSANLNV